MYRIDLQLHQYRTVPSGQCARGSQGVPVVKDTPHWRCNGRCGGEYPTTTAAHSVQLGPEILAHVCDADHEEVEKDLNNFLDGHPALAGEFQETAVLLRLSGVPLATIGRDGVTFMRTDLLQFFDLDSSALNEEDDDNDDDNDDDDDDELSCLEPLVSEVAIQVTTAVAVEVTTTLPTPGDLPHDPPSDLPYDPPSDVLPADLPLDASTSIAWPADEEDTLTGVGTTSSSERSRENNGET